MVSDKLVLPDFLALPRAVHPGEFIREDVLPMLDMDVPTAAKQVGLSPTYLQRLVDEQIPVTAVTAFALGALAGNNPQAWMDAQVAYDLWHAHRLGPTGRERIHGAR